MWPVREPVRADMEETRDAVPRQVARARVDGDPALRRLFIGGSRTHAGGLRAGGLPHFRLGPRRVRAGGGRPPRLAPPPPASEPAARPPAVPERAASPPADSEPAASEPAAAAPTPEPAKA